MKPIVPYTLTIGGSIPKQKYDFFLTKISQLYLNDTSNKARISRKEFIRNSIRELNNKPLVLNINCRNGTLNSDTLMGLGFLKLSFIFRISPFIDSNGLNINEYSICSDPVFGLRDIKTDGRNQPIICISDVLYKLNSIKNEYEKSIEEAALQIHNKNLPGTIARMKLGGKNIWEILENELIPNCYYEFPEIPPLVIS